MVIERVLQQYSHSNHQLICLAPDDVPDSPSVEMPSGQGSDSAAATPDVTGAGDPSPESPATKPGRGAGSTSDSAATGTETVEQPAAESDDDVSEVEQGDNADRERFEAAKRIFEAREIE